MPDGSACESLDGDPAVSNVCVEGDCTHNPTGKCVIGGKQWAGQVANPANECEWCDPSSSTQAWVPKPKGAACSTDNLDCTSDVCDGHSECGHVLIAGKCLIGGTCYGVDAQSPDDGCLVCDPGVDTADWVWSSTEACNPCGSDDDCGAGKVCVEGKCEAAPPTGCTTDEECGADKKCENGKCVGLPRLPECTSDSECGDGQKCENNACKDIQCKGYEDCDGRACVNGQCIATYVEGSGCGCGVVGSTAASSGGIASLLALLGAAVGLVRRRRG